MNIVPVFLHHNVERKVWIVTVVKCFDYKYEDTRWMNDPDYGDECQVPQIDIVESKREFTTESEALVYVAKCYTGQFESK